MNFLKDSINPYLKYPRVTKEEWILIGSKLKKQTLKAGDFWLTEGKTCAYIGHIEKGVMRTFYIDDKGNKRTFLFHFPTNIVTDFESFAQKAPSKFYIECVSDATIYAINYEDREFLMNSIPDYKQLVLEVTQDYLLFLNERMVNMALLSAEERYLRLLRFEPHVGDYLTLSCMAEYLNIKPQSLSRIRKKVHEKR